MTDLNEALRRKKRRAEALDAALARAVGRLRDLGALRVTLFGSAARGETDLGSDLDLLVIMPATGTGREWMRQLNDKLSRDVAMDLLVFAEDEWERELPRNSFLRYVQEHGRVVYEKALQ